MADEDVKAMLAEMKKSHDAMAEQLKVLQDKQTKEKEKETEKEPEKKGNETDKTVNERVKAEVLAEQERVKQLEEYGEFTRFNTTIGSYLKDNAQYLPSDCQRIVDMCVKETSTQDARSNLIKKSLIEKVFETQKNIDDLPETQRTKIVEFLGNTSEVKLKKAAACWEVLDILVGGKRKAAERQEIIKANNGMQTGKDKMADKLAKCGSYLRHEKKVSNA